MNGLQSGLLVALTVALVSVEGCGKSSKEIAAEKVADEASSRVAAEKAQAELDADAKRFRELATAPPPEHRQGSELVLSPQVRAMSCFELGQRTAGVYIANLETMYRYRFTSHDVLDPLCEKKAETSGPSCMQQCLDGWNSRMPR
jgi:hypothetical protein